LYIVFKASRASRNVPLRRPDRADAERDSTEIWITTCRVWFVIDVIAPRWRFR